MKKVKAFDLDWRSTNEIITSQQTIINDFLQTVTLCDIVLFHGRRDERIAIIYEETIPQVKHALYVKKLYDETTGEPIEGIADTISQQLGNLNIFKILIQDDIAFVIYEV